MYLLHTFVFTEQGKLSPSLIHQLKLKYTVSDGYNGIQPIGGSDAT